MSLALIDRERPPKRPDHSELMKSLSDEAAAIFRLHEDRKIDAYEAARRLNELKARHRTFLDRLIG